MVQKRTGTISEDQKKAGFGKKSCLPRTRSQRRLEKHSCKKRKKRNRIVRKKSQRERREVRKEWFGAQPLEKVLLKGKKGSTLNSEAEGVDSLREISTIMGSSSRGGTIDQRTIWERGADPALKGGKKSD